MKKIKVKNVIVLVVVTLFTTILLSSCASTGMGCGGSYVKNYNMCPAYH